MKTTIAYGKKTLIIILAIILAFACSTVAFADDRTIADLSLPELEEHLKEMEDLRFELTELMMKASGFDEWSILNDELKDLNDYIQEVKDAIKAAKKEHINESYGKEITEYDEWAEFSANMERYKSLSPEEQMRIFNEEVALGLYGDTAAMREEKAAQAAAKEAAAHAAKPITLVVNGVTVKTDSPPVVVNGRTLAPLRSVVEAMGYVVSWDAAKQNIKVYEMLSEDLRIDMTIGLNRAKVSTGVYGVLTDVYLDVPAKTINGRTMVPVRFIAESLGCTVNWDEKTKTVTITQNKG